MLDYETPLSGYHPAIGGSAGKGTHGGTAVERPDGMPTKQQADFVVSTKRELLDAVQVDGATVYIDDDIDVTGAQNVWLGDNVTVVGGYCDPEIPGRGPILKNDYYHRHIFRTRSPTTWYGVAFKGPNTQYFDPRDRAAPSSEWNSDHPSDWYSGGVHAYPRNGTVRFIGCAFWGWTLAGVELGAKGVETDAEVYRCSFFDSPMETAGYGIEHYNGRVDVRYCFFDTSRHGISGFGHETEEIHVTDSVFGPGPWSGHALDMHDLGANIDGAGDVAGRYLRADRCTFQGTRDVRGYDQEGLAIRGVSTEQSHVRDSHFWHAQKPVPTGNEGDAYRQAVDGSWRNFKAENNHFGQPVKDGFGAPRASQDEETEQPAEPTTMKLTVHGRGISGRYEIVVKGDVEPTGDVEGNDEMTDIGNGRTKIAGGIVGKDDTYVLSDDAIPERGTWTTPVRVTLNGEDITGQITPVEMSRRLDEQDKRIDNFRGWLGSQLNSLRIVPGGRNE